MEIRRTRDATGDAPADLVRVGVRKSTDGGRTWQPLAGSPSVVTALAFDPEKHTVVFAGTRDGRIVVSADGGVSWQPPR